MPIKLTGPTCLHCRRPTYRDGLCVDHYRLLGGSEFSDTLADIQSLPET